MKTFVQTLLLLLNGLLFVFPQSPSARSQSAVPLWSHVVPPVKGVVSSTPVGVVVTTNVVVVEGAGNASSHNRASGLRRSDGAQMWQTPEDALGNEILSPLHSASVVFFVPSPEGQGHGTQAVDAQTGLTLWQTSGTDVCQMLIGVYDSVTALADTTGRLLQLVNTRTGKKLDPKQDADHALIAGEITPRSGATIPVTVLGRPCLLDLNTATLVPVPWAQVVPAWDNPEIRPGSAEFIGLITRPTPKPSLPGGNATLIVRVDEDNGMPGHSLFPKYLVGLSALGKHRWQYPTSVSPPDKVDWSDRIQAAWVANSAGVIIAQTQNRHLSGVDVRTGKRIWQRVLPNMVAGGSVYDRGVLALSISTTQSKREGNVTSRSFPVQRRLDYVDARTGKVSCAANLTLGTTPGWYVTTSLSAVGEQVFVVTPNRIYVYNGRNLLQSVLPASPQMTPAPKQASAPSTPRYLYTPLNSLPPNPECEEKGTQALAINNRGQIVGQSWERPVLWQNGKVRVLPLLPGDNVGGAYAINNQGDVLIHSERRENAQAALWRAGRLIRLGTLGGRESHVVAANEKGQVIGYSTTSPDNPGGVAEHPFVWRNGKIRDLGTLPGYHSGRPTAINRRGQIVGFCYNGPNFHYDAPFRDQRAFVWDNGKMRDLGALPGDRYSRAEGINNSGQIIGESARNAAPKYQGRAVTWRQGRIIDLGALGDGRSRATHINDAGDILGESPVTPKGFWQPVRWHEGRMQPLPPPANTDVVDVRGLDAQGRIYLPAWPAGKLQHAYVWQKGAYKLLPLFPPTAANVPANSAAAAQNAPNIQSVTATGRVLFTPALGGQLFVYENGSTRPVLRPDQFIVNNGINALYATDAGDFLGDAMPSSYRVRRDFLLRQGKIVPFFAHDPKRVATLAGLNDVGQVVGQQILANDVAHNDPLRQAFVPRGFVWQNGKTIWLNANTIPGFVLTPSAINNRGQIVGMLALHSLRFNNSSADGPTLWENGKTRKLNNLALEPVAINDAGLIAGYVQRGIETVEAEPRAASYTAPAVWQNGRETQLVTGQAFDSHAVHALNRQGQVVGDTNAGAFVWQAGKMLFLSSVLPPTQNWKQSTATGINDRGQIVGSNTLQEPSTQERHVIDIVSHAFLLTPKPQ